MSLPTGKILTGAPRASDLDWSEDAYLNASIASSSIDNSRAKFGPDTSKFRSIGTIARESSRDDSIRLREPSRLAQLDEAPATPRALSSTADTDEDANMVNRLNAVTVPDDMTLGPVDDNKDNSFLSTGKPTKFFSSSLSDRQKENKEYLEQSFMLYDNSLSKHLSLTPSFDSGTTQESTEPLSTTNSLASTPTESQLPMIQLPSPISDLKRLPNAAYINQISPQTITVNLAVGIINIVPPRNIKLKQTKQKMDLVEMIVADETRSGFQISFWLPADPEAKDTTRKTIKELRPLDCILLKNVALHVWNGKVFGQSMRKGWTKTETTVITYARNGVWEVQLGEKNRGLEETKLVRAFENTKTNFLPRPVTAWTYASGVEKPGLYDELPPETQSPKRQTRRGTEFG